MPSLQMCCDVTSGASARNEVFHPIFSVVFGKSIGNQIRFRVDFLHREEIIHREIKDSMQRMQSTLAAYRDHEDNGTLKIYFIIR